MLDLSKVLNNIIIGDALLKLKELPSESVHCIVTSPPYYRLRDYRAEGQLGLEETPEEYIEKVVDIFREARRVLREDGTLWLNLGDTYDSPRLLGIPWRVALALQDDGWILRSDIIWSKKNCRPESCTNRPSRTHEYMFLFSKSEKYYYDHNSIKEPVKESSIKRMKNGFKGNGKYTTGEHGLSPHSFEKGKYYGNKTIPMFRNKKSVWETPTSNLRGFHSAPFPPQLIEPCILAGCPSKGIVLDPFMGAGTTGLVAAQNGRNFIGIEINEQYVHLSLERIRKHIISFRLCG